MDLSYGGRKILIDACLDNVPTYLMGFYRLQEGLHVQIDSIRAKFFWEGIGKKKRKYHMIQWDDLCRPKEFGGMGFMNSRVRNIALLMKWIMKLESGVQDLSCQLLRAKYLGEAGFFQSVGAGGSQFWKGLHAVKEWFRLGSAYEVGNGKWVRFWEDVWVGETPLCVHFFRLFRCCEQQGDTVAQVLGDNGIHLSFRRTFGEAEQVEWAELCGVLDSVLLSDTRDRAFWCLTKNKCYTTQSLYSAMLHSGVKDLEMMDLWHASIPLKHKIFVSLSIRGRIQVTEELAKKGWSGERGCQLCGAPETSDHLLFLCPIASFMWHILKEAFGWHRVPSCFGDFRELCLLRGGPCRHKWWSLLAAVDWSLWLTRNDLVPLQVAFRMLGFLTGWKALLHEQRKEPTLKLIAQVLAVLQRCVDEDRNRRRLELDAQV